MVNFWPMGISHVIIEIIFGISLLEVLGKQGCRWMGLFRKSWRGHTGSKLVPFQSADWWEMRGHDCHGALPHGNHMSNGFSSTGHWNDIAEDNGTYCQPFILEGIYDHTHKCLSAFFLFITWKKNGDSSCASVSLVFLWSVCIAGPAPLVPS